MLDKTFPRSAPRQQVERESEDNGQEQVRPTAEEEQRSSDLSLRQTEHEDGTTQHQQQVPTADEELPVANIPQLNNEDVDQHPEVQYLVAPAMQHNYELPCAANPLDDSMHARLQAVAETVRREDEQAWDDSWASRVETDIRRSMARLMAVE
ncbi:hypothetical protein CKM354_000655100 [Cercospora kikuchii]|uniref:Uncharacterized protein n=1 Tax=Cercospora kikuchii TaxID=84275 RepID=A0A9P3FHX8_9PEZI|nr:uncharacterized protein CKM354_000655100 [Cercospora kikuchii]GIZ43319.1 hypothetical protein CKM354_000655100 [Cercospora kikuchii]